MNTDLHFSSKKHDWPTPPEVFDPLNEEFRFTIDVCATPENAKCSRYFTEEDDGLSRPWGGEVCWMNPPYGRAISQWMKKAKEESEAGATVVCLVPARTDTRWWHDYAAHGEIRFLKGRVRFLGGRYKAPFPSAIVIFRG